MKINIQRGNLGKVARHYRRRFVMHVAVFGLLSGIIAQTGSLVVQYQNAFAANGYNWSTVRTSNILDAYTMNPSHGVSDNGQHIVWTTGTDVSISDDEGQTWRSSAPRAITPIGMGTPDHLVVEVLQINDDGQVITLYERPLQAMYQTTNGGQSWNTINTPQDVPDPSEMHVSNDGQTIIYTNGTSSVYSSTDGGATWSDSGPGDEGGYYHLAASEDGQHIITADTSIGFKLTNDGGATWSEVVIPDSTFYDHVDMSNDGQTIVLYTTIFTTDYFTAVVTSNDGGATWNTRISPSAIDAYAQPAMSADGSKILLYGTTGDSTATFADISTDGGETWSSMPETTANKALYLTPLKVSVSNGSGPLYSFGYLRFHKSIDGGASWTTHLRNQMSVQTVGLSRDGSTVFGFGMETTNNLGVGTPYASTDNGTTWQPLFDMWNTPDSTCFISGYGAFSPNGTSILVQGKDIETQDGCYFVSTDSGATWSRLNGTGDGWYVTQYDKVISDDGQTIIFESASTGIMITHDGGATWSNPADVYSGDQIVMSDDGQKIVTTFGNQYSTRGIQISTDGGLTWQTTTLPNVWHHGAIAISGDGARIIVNADDGWNSSDMGMYTSTDDGASWTRMAFQGEEPEGYSWHQIAMSVDGQRIAFIQSGVSGAVVWTSIDGGQTIGVQGAYTSVNPAASTGIFMSGNGKRLVSADTFGAFAFALFGFTPGAIADASATPGTRSATVTWETPEVLDPEDPITAYELQYRLRGATEWTTVSNTINPSSTSYTVGGLTAGATYEFRIRAGNVFGWTAWEVGYGAARTVSTPFASNDFSKAMSGGALAVTNGGVVVGVSYPDYNTPPDGCDTSDTSSCPPDYAWSFYESTNRGQTWTAKNGNLNLADRMSTAVPPPGILKVSSNGLVRFMTPVSQVAGSVYRSTNAGSTWTPVASGDHQWNQLTVSENGQYVYGVTTAGEVYGSTDTGETWNQISGFNDARGLSSSGVISLHVLNSGKVYLGLLGMNADVYGSGLVSSEDNGATWTDENDNPVFSRFAISVMTSSVLLPLLEYVSGNGTTMAFGSMDPFSGTSDMALHFTQNAGETWSLYSNAASAEGFYPLAIAQLFNPGTHAYTHAYTSSGDVYYYADTSDSNFSLRSISPTVVMATIPNPSTGGTTGGGNGGGTGTTGGSPATPGGTTSGTNSGGVGAGGGRSVQLAQESGDLVDESDTDDEDITEVSVTPIIPMGGAGIDNAEEKKPTWFDQNGYFLWLLPVIAALIAIIIWGILARARQKQKQQQYSPFNHYQ